MNLGVLKDLAWRYLVKLYELSEGGLHPEVEGPQLKSALGYSHEQMRSAYGYLLDKGWADNDCRVPCVHITTKGIDEVERVMAQTYAAKEFRVLKTIRDTKYKEFNGWVDLDNLEKELPDTPRQELHMILEDLEKRKGLIGSIDQAVWIVPAGIEELERAERYPDRSTQYFPPQIINNYNVTIQDVDNANVMQNSPGGNQSISLIHNQPVSEILPKLAELINAVRQADFEDKEDVIRDLEKAQELALANPQATPKEGIWKRIQTKLDAAKTSMEIVGYAYNSLPYWPVVWRFFFG